jgi:hypothetical protein
MLPSIERITNRAKRELIAKFPPATRLAQQRHRAALQDHRPRLPTLDDRQRRQVRQLAEDGILAAPWSDLGQPGVEDLKPLLTSLADVLASRPHGDGSTVPLTRDEMLEDLRLFRWGLQDEVLDLVENHLGMPACHYPPLVRRELADSRVATTRQWHRDIEDHRVLKILVWLNDVDEDGGPFTYVPLDASRSAVRPLRYVGGFVKDHRFAAVVPQSAWLQATGPRWTAVMPDTAQIFHRAQAPVARDRYSVTFTWTSRTPVKVIPDEPWRRDQARRAVRDLGGRHLAALPAALLSALS